MESAESETLAEFLRALDRTSDRATLIKWAGISLDPWKVRPLVQAFPTGGFPTPADADAWVRRTLPTIEPGS